ncbi:hypothetical protein RYX36_016592, partial [Vicia faba]
NLKPSRRGFSCEYIVGEALRKKALCREGSMWSLFVQNVRECDEDHCGSTSLERVRFLW